MDIIILTAIMATITTTHVMWATGEGRRGKLSPLLMLMLKLIPGTGTIMVTTVPIVTTVPMDTMDTTTEESRIRYQDNLWNMILLENKASISFVQFNFQYSSDPD